MSLPDSLLTNPSTLRHVERSVYKVSTNQKATYALKFGAQADNANNRSMETQQWVPLESERRNAIILNAFGGKAPIGSVMTLNEDQKEFWLKRLNRPVYHVLVRPFVHGTPLSKMRQKAERHELKQRAMDEFYASYILCAHEDMKPEDILYLKKENDFASIDCAEGIFLDNGDAQPDLTRKVPFFELMEDKRSNLFKETLIDPNMLTQKAESFLQIIESTYPKELEEFGEELRQVLHARATHMIDHFKNTL
jgi:hypothetical protein